MADVKKAKEMRVFSSLFSLLRDVWEFLKIIIYSVMFGLNLLLAYFLILIFRTVIVLPGIVGSEVLFFAVFIYYRREKTQIRNKDREHDGVYEAERERAKQKRF